MMKRAIKLLLASDWKQKKENRKKINKKLSAKYSRKKGDKNGPKLVWPEDN